jgi:hypothetical protein
MASGSHFLMILKTIRMFISLLKAIRPQYYTTSCPKHCQCPPKAIIFESLDNSGTGRLQFGFL